MSEQINAYIQYASPDLGSECIYVGYNSVFLCEAQRITESS